MVAMDGWSAYDVRASKNLRRLRKARGMSAQGVADEAKKLGGMISQPQIAQTENGRRRLSLDNVAVLARVFDVSPLEFLYPIEEDGFTEREIRSHLVGLYNLPDRDTTPPIIYAQIGPLVAELYERWLGREVPNPEAFYPEAEMPEEEFLRKLETGEIKEPEYPELTPEQLQKMFDEYAASPEYVEALKDELMTVKEEYQEVLQRVERLEKGDGGR